MAFPLQSFLAVSASNPWTYVVFGLIGFAFGFTLEMSGFGNSRKLAAQFYFTDLTVLKVMFTAIVTAMVLLFGAVGLGLGVAIGLRPYVQDDLAAGRLVAPFAIAVPKGKAWYLIASPARRDDPAFVAFRDWLLAQAKA